MIHLKYFILVIPTLVSLARNRSVLILENSVRLTGTVRHAFRLSLSGRRLLPFLLVLAYP